eukprot:TRINITY_DN3027_c0_g1_i1.p1 TRINITY_DN3027_c0_g1~~TRINITY_DN3027_c0_g1_i1.p1  ORF type:complete len:710 (-),score=177.74 TRINITY_DN3027_c0_g1_i1:908-2977(-)
MADSTNTLEYAAHVKEAAAFVKSKVGEVDIALVLGSGLGDFAEQVSDPLVISYADIPHLPQPTVSGHAGRLVFGRVGEKRVLCLAGRVHSYEGLEMFQVTFAARMVIQLGVRLFIATNAAGGAQDGMQPGAIMVIRDHINELKRTPFAETSTHPGLGPRNPSGNGIYSERLAQEAERVASAQGFKINQGVYCCSPGPTYETNSEVASGRAGGADAFGMSTAPSTTVAASLGVETFAMSLCTNMAAGMSDEVLTHTGVKDVASQAGPRFIKFMHEFLSTIELKEAPKSLLDDEHDAAAVPLPIPHHAPATNQEVAAAAEFVGAKLRSGDARPVALLHVAGELFDGALPEVTASLPLREVPHFPLTSASGLSGELVCFEKNGSALLALRGLGMEGLWPEESTFLASLVHALGISRIVHFVMGGGSSDAVPADTAVEIQDLVDATTCHPVPHTSSAKNFYCAQPLLAPLALESVPARATFVSFLGPAFPTPAERRMASVGAEGPQVHGIASLDLVYAAASLGIQSSAFACTALSADSFAASSKAASVANALMSAVLDNVSQIASPKDLAAVEYTAHSGVVNTYQLTPPNSQGNFEQVEHTAQAFNTACGDAPFASIVTFDRDVFDVVCARISAQPLDRALTPHLPQRDVVAVGALQGGKKCVAVLQQCFFHLGHSGADVGHPMRISFSRCDK